MNLAHHDLETKAGFAPDTRQETHVTHAEMMRTFDAFKAANDERIASIERRSADVLHEEKVARIDAVLDA
jgi:predicted phage gp36 major capsid-like protein